MFEGEGAPRNQDIFASGRFYHQNQGIFEGRASFRFEYNAMLYNASFLHAVLDFGILERGHPSPFEYRAAFDKSIIFLYYVCRCDSI